jgi:acyl carrier protein
MTDERSRSDDYERFRRCVVGIVQVPPEKVTTDASFQDLGLDDLDVVEMAMALEEEFDIHLNESAMKGVKTVGRLYEMVVRTRR